MATEKCLGSNTVFGIYPPKWLGFCYWLGFDQLGVTSALFVWWLKIGITLC